MSLSAYVSATFFNLSNKVTVYGSIISKFILIAFAAKPRLDNPPMIVSISILSSLKSTSKILPCPPKPASEIRISSPSPVPPLN